MKKYLPASKKACTERSRSGFTLIEILVVISIIAILAVIGVSVYSGAQANARDGKRRAEVASIAKSIEASRDPVAGTYSYTTTEYNADFKNNKPKDPSDPSRKYCISTNQTTNDSPTATGTIVTGTGNVGCATFTCPAAIGTAPANTCATVEISGSLSAGITGTTAAKGWTICAVLEKGGTTVCHSNAQ